MLDRVIQTIRNVRYVPNRRRNLLSLISYDKKGYMFAGNGRVLKVFKDGYEKLRAKRKTSYLYFLDLKTIPSDVVVFWYLFLIQTSPIFGTFDSSVSVFKSCLNLVEKDYLLIERLLVYSYMKTVYMARKKRWDLWLVFILQKDHFIFTHIYRDKLVLHQKVEFICSLSLIISLVMCGLSSWNTKEKNFLPSEIRKYKSKRN